MKISEAMQKGWDKVGKQAFGSYFRGSEGSACALGCAYLGYNPEYKPEDYNGDLYTSIYSMNKRLNDKSIECLPDASNPTNTYNLAAQIIMCNDNKRMTVPKIIEGLRECGL